MSRGGNRENPTEAAWRAIHEEILGCLINLPEWASEKYQDDREDLEQDMFDTPLEKSVDAEFIAKRRAVTNYLIEQTGNPDLKITSVLNILNKLRQEADRFGGKKNINFQQVLLELVRGAVYRFVKDRKNRRKVSELEERLPPFLQQSGGIEGYADQIAREIVLDYVLYEHR